ncbi:unnamed protein product (macronuclear) [Paramecium tetraurelia]|uniref:Uncharacterized protein n=1 Tax=Paramecium tetraurelia TaxID=5888 RepID=A0DDK3_PARTE|nr:uncharacterized protein GSPATT00039427001 [Paramecium tetraurelia]CAK81120.1 unnamed protein product [Paramecium tetraurelia]|eukprot:XP_001448517.1 hypothetical protein (macronuclear) [Paramecium tetraurelia strain d4-2]
MLDTLNSGQHDVALVMNLLLALKISQQDLFELNYQNIQEEDNYCIIYLQNEEKLILKRENLLPELQMKFWGNIGSIFNVVEGQQSNKRNKINEQFNETRKILINNLEKSEKDQTYQNFLLQINLNNYKMMDKTNLRIFKLADNDLQKLQEQKKEIQQLKQASKSDSKQEKALQEIPNQESIEAQCKSQVANQKVQPVQQIQNKTK